MPPKPLARTLLLAVVLIWGATFVLVKTALTDASPLLFNLLRMTLATAALLLLNRNQLRAITRPHLAAGATAGLFLAAGYQFQTLGLARTTPAKSAFVTGLVVVFVPALTLIPFLRPKNTRRPGPLAALAALLAFTGLILLTTPAGTRASDILQTIAPGDLLTLIAAFAFALHLLTLGRLSPGIPAGLFATLQIAFATAVMLLTLPLEQTLYLHLTPALILTLLITALLGTAFAFTVQSFAQQHLPPTQTALVLTLEPVFGALTSLLVLHERFTPRTLLGAALILLAILLLEALPAVLHSTEIPA